MKRSPLFSSRFWVSLSVFCLAGLCFAPSSASADTIWLPDPLSTNFVYDVYFGLDLLQESVWIVSDFESYEDSYVSTTNSLVRLMDLCDTYRVSASDLAENVRTNTASWPSRYQSYLSRLVDSIESLSIAYGDLFYDVYDAHSEVVLQHSLISPADVITSVEVDYSEGASAGGSCSCPDYSTYLLYIEGVLDDLNDTVQVWDVRFSDFRAGLLTMFSSDTNIGRGVADVLYKIHAGEFHPTNDISRPLWVAFTNDVHIAGVVEISGNVGVTNFAELVHMLTNSVLKVKDGETEQERHDKMSADLSFMSGILDDDLEEPVHQTEQFEQISVSRLSSVSSSVSSVIDSYENMFDSIPSEFPADIVVHPGFSIGPLEVPSMHWNPYNSERSGLNYLRQFMRSLWYVGFVVVIWYAVAIDLLLIGSVICVCYGVAFAQPQESLKGIRFFFGIFASMLGFSPPST